MWKRFSPMIVAQMLCIQFCILASSTHAYATQNATETSEKHNSIQQYRIFYPKALQQIENSSFIRQVTEGPEGYLWLSGSKTEISRYNGYDLQVFKLDTIATKGKNEILSVHKDQDNTLFAGNALLHEYLPEEARFVSKNITDSKFIHAMESDSNGNLWLGGDEFGFLGYNKALAEISFKIERSQYPNAPNLVSAFKFDDKKNRLWMSSDKGIFVFNLSSKTLKRINTPIDDYFPSFFVKDLSIDKQRSLLWIPTPMGLLKINTTDLTVDMYTKTNSSTLPTSYISSTLIDTENNLWIGLEKEGICRYHNQKSKFDCLAPSDDKENSLPFATVESIYEDSTGNFWLSMNSQGFYRLTPDLERFHNLQQRISVPYERYFRKTFGGVVRDNGDIWIATDGGGIQIFNHQTGNFSTFNHDPLNPNSLPSDSVISIKEGPKGNIWVGMWAGGVAEINPDTMQVKAYPYSPSNSADQGLAGNNVFHIGFNHDKGAYFSVWFNGIQYLDFASGKFSTIETKSKEIHDFKVIDNILWITGSAGFEKYDLLTKQSKVVMPLSQSFFSIFQLNQDTIYFGTVGGFFIYNLKTGNSEFVEVKDDNRLVAVYYFYQAKDGSVWLGTNRGLVVYEPDSGDLALYNETDGLIGNSLTTFGEFFEADGEIYIPGHNGVNIIRPNQLPELTTIPTTILSEVNVFSDNDTEEEISFLALDKNNTTTIPFSHNTLEFEFLTLSYVFPENNAFKYRLIGLENNFNETNSQSRIVRYNHLAPGKYTFKVYAANSKGRWDEKGTQFEFEILKPWWQTWWARLFLFFAILFTFYLIARWRLSIAKVRELQLAKKVNEKTHQLQTNSIKLKEASTSLATLNQELEQRVSARTAELEIEINERKIAESKLFHMAFHDSLTGLPNREWLIDTLKRLVSKNQNNEDQAFGLLFLDGDRFKQINDTHGHIAGDELLIQSAMRISGLLKNDQHAARLGGDEFTVVSESAECVEELSDLANRLIVALKEPFNINGVEIYFNVSIGVLLCDKRYVNVTSVLRDADFAMYHAKDAGKGIYKVFDHEMRKVSMELAEIEVEIYKATIGRGFHLVYQPIIDMATHTLSGFEALIRWQHSERGLIPPDVFIPIAEENGLIVEIGAWVLERACEQLKEWHKVKGCEHLTMAINVSSNQLRGNSLLETLDEVIAKVGMPGRFIRLELTESCLIDNSQDIAKLLEEIIARSVQLAIDDFGTGYSSLAYLNRLPVQHIKIDRGFIDAIDNTSDGSINESALEVVKATINLGHSLNMKVTAEGIESEKQLGELQKIEADFVQGYYLSKPLEESDVSKFIQQPFEYLGQSVAPDPLKTYKNKIDTRRLRRNRTN